MAGIRSKVSGRSCVSGRCGWCSSIRASIRRSGRRSARSREKLGMTSRDVAAWVRRAEVDEGHRPGLTTDERARLKELERENRELRRANEILKSASAFFAAELDGRQEVIAYIDAHRDRFGVEPICRALQFAPSTYWAAKRRPPCARRVRDDELAARDRAGARGELRRLRRGQGVGPAQPRRPSGSRVARSSG